MTWYMKGQSDYDSANFHMGLYFDVNGFASGDYVTLVMPTDVSKGDPFLTVAAETQPSWNPGSQNVEIGLWNDYRIKITSTGIYGRNEGTSSWVDLLVGGGASQLSDLSDVSSVVYTTSYVLRANGSGYVSAQLDYSDLSGIPSSFTPATHVLATSGPHTGTLPWSDLSKTGSNLTDLITRQHAGLTDVTADQHHAQSHDNTYHTTNYKIDFSENTAFNKNFGTLGTEVCIGNDSRLSDARTPISHNNTYHSETYVTASGAVSAVEAEAGLDLKGNIIVNTNSNVEPLIISRNTAITQAFKIGVDDTYGYINYVQDETDTQAHSVLFDITSGASGNHAWDFKVNTVSKLKIGDDGLVANTTLAMSSNKITGLTNGSASSDAMAFGQKYTDANAVSAVATADDYVKNIGDAMTGALAMGTNKVTGVGDPTNNQDVVTKKYSDVTHSEQVKAGFNLSGGGNISFGVVAGKFKWTQRFIVIAHGRGSHFSTTGYFDITQPTTGTCTGVGGAGDQTWSVDGITLSSWTALYYILPIGSSSGSIAVNFRLCTYTGNVEIPDEWILLAVNNGDSTSVRIGIGVHIDTGRTFQATIAQIDKLIGDDTAYLGSSWNAHTGVPTKNVVRDLMEDKIFESSSTFPASPFDGQLHYDIDDDSFYRYNIEALAWVEVGVGGGRGEADTFPIGSIIMFSGSFTNNITMIGWYKCDGTNGTVNLVNKFVRGGSSSGASGGSDDAIVVTHNHAGSTAINAGGHVHNRRFWWGTGTVKKPNEFDVGNNYTDFDNDSAGDHGHNLTIVSNGSSGVGKNLPTYYTLIFIQRIT